VRVWLSNFRPETGALTITYFPVGLPKGHGEFDAANLFELGWRGLYGFDASDMAMEQFLKEMKTMKNTEEQIKFFSRVEFGTGNILLESVAGSGKTTSIVQCLNYIDDTEPILCCSFTKLASLQLDKKIRAQDFTNVQSSTLNSIGWSSECQGLPA